MSALPGSWNAFEEGFVKTKYQQVAERFDPHPNPDGSRAMAGAIKEVVER